VQEIDDADGSTGRSDARRHCGLGRGVRPRRRRAEDGIGWMIARRPHWAEDSNFFKVHNWRHRALYHLDLGQRDEVLALYDGALRGGRNDLALSYANERIALKAHSPINREFLRRAQALD
jgi:hypothetical protein